MSNLAVTLTVAELEALVERAVKKASAPSPETLSEVLTRVQVAKLLQVHPNVISQYVHERGLPARRVGGEFRFLRSEVMQWVRAQERVAGKEGA